MRFLIDNALSPFLSKKLSELGHDAVHVREYDLGSASDKVIFERALKEDRVIVSADTDFGMLLSIWKYKKPSFILFRRGTDRNPVKQFELIKNNYDRIKKYLEDGSIVVFDENRIRVRSLPMME